MVCTGNTFHTLLYIHGDESSSSEKEVYLLTAEHLLYYLTGRSALWCQLTGWLVYKVVLVSSVSLKAY
jgi:hypothetical protein